MSEIDLQNTFLFLALTWTPAQIVKALLLSGSLGVGVALLHRLTQPGQIASLTLQRTLVLLSMIGTLVMLVIGSNLARAFSLVGALSIIRFRTRVRSSWDISFVFFALAVGIGCGVMAWEVTTIGSAVVGLVILLLQAIPGGFNPRGEVQLLRVDLSSYEGVETRVYEVLDRRLAGRTLEEAQSQRFGETLSYRFRVLLKAKNTIEELIRELSQIEGVERVVVVQREEGEADDD